jgi:hypothetical protein
MGRAWSSDFTTTERQRAPGPRSSSSARSTTAAWFERVREACNDTPGPYQAHPHPQTPPQKTYTHARTHAHTQHAQSLSHPPTHTQSPHTHAGRAVPHRGPRAAPAPDRARAGSPLAEAGCPRYRHRRRPPPRSPIRRLRPRPRPRRRRRAARSGGRRGQRRGTAPGPTRSPARRTCPARPAVITRAPPDTCRRARFHAPQRAGIRDISKHRDMQTPARCGAWNRRELAVICIRCVFRGSGGGVAGRFGGWGWVDGQHLCFSKETLAAQAHSSTFRPSRRLTARTCPALAARSAHLSVRLIPPVRISLPFIICTRLPTSARRTCEGQATAGLGGARATTPTGARTAPPG